MHPRLLTGSRATPLALLTRTLPVLSAVLLAACAGPPPNEEEACLGIVCSAGRCALVAEEVQCVCSPVEEVLGRRCHIAADYSKDDHGDTPATATALTLPVQGQEAQLNVFRGSQDRDVFSFEAQAGHIYALGCAPGSAEACELSVQDPTGSSVPLLPAPEPNGLRHMKATQSGRHVLTVMGRGLGTYRLDVLEVGVDDHPDSRAKASALSAPGEVMAAFESFGDVDCFSYPAAADHVYLVTLTLGTGGEAVLELTRLNGASLGTVDANAVARAASVYMRGSGEAAFACVSATGASWGSYQLRVEDLGPEDHGDTFATATPVQAGTTATGLIAPVGDADAFVLDGQAGHAYDIQCTVGTLPGCSVAALLPTGESLRLRPLGSRWRLLVDADGPLLLNITGTTSYKGPPAVGSYSLQVTDVGVDDYGSTNGEATLIGLGSIQGDLEHPDDRDVFAYDARYDDILLVSCSCLFFVDAAPGVLRSVSLGDEGGPFDLHMDARIHVVAYGFGPYELTLTRQGVDDAGESAAYATPIPVGQTIAGMLELPWDLDVFRLELDGPRHYRMDVPDIGLETRLYTADLVTMLPLEWPSVGRRDFTTQQPGTYYLVVNHVSATATGPYRFGVWPEP